MNGPLVSREANIFTWGADGLLEVSGSVYGLRIQSKPSLVLNGRTKKAAQWWLAGAGARRILRRGQEKKWVRNRFFAATLTYSQPRTGRSFCAAKRRLTPRPESLPDAGRSPEPEPETKGQDSLAMIRRKGEVGKKEYRSRHDEVGIGFGLVVSTG